MSSVNFRWLPEPVVLKKAEPAFPDQARSHSKTGLSPPPHSPPIVYLAPKLPQNYFLGWTAFVQPPSVS